jgi:hypothetical protein
MPFSDSAHQKTLKTAKMMQKVFNGSQNAGLCYFNKVTFARSNSSNMF